MNRSGPYTLVRKLATGGMAEVYLAQRAGARTPLVVKRVLPHLAVDQNFLAMFLNEARLAAQLDHPNVARVTDLGEDAGVIYLAMEYVDGPSLRAVLKRAQAEQRPLSQEVVARLSIQVCAGLQYAHDAVGADGADVGDRPLEVVGEHPDHVRRSGDHERTRLLQVEMAHRVDHVGVGRRHPAAAVHPLLPDRQHVVTGPERPLRPVAHADHIERRQHGHVGMDGALVIQLVHERPGFSLVEPVAVVDLFKERRSLLRDGFRRRRLFRWR